MWTKDSFVADAESDWEIQGLFDDIEYQKGGSVLRMLWDYMSSSHYASSRLPADTQPGHDDNVSSSGLSYLCLHPMPCQQSLITAKHTCRAGTHFGHSDLGPLSAMAPAQ